MKQIMLPLMLVLVLSLCLSLCSCVKSESSAEAPPAQTEQGPAMSRPEQKTNPELTTEKYSETINSTMEPSAMGTWRPAREYAVENGKNGERRFIKDNYYQYNDDGRLLRLLQFNENGTCSSFFEYSYDERGYLIRRDVYQQPASEEVSSDATLKRSYFYQYDENGWMTEFNDAGEKIMEGENYTPEEQQFRLTNTGLLEAVEDGKTCIRDDYGNIVAVEDYYEGGNVHYRTEWEYVFIPNDE